MCDAEDVLPDEVVPSPQFMAVVNELLSGSEIEYETEDDDPSVADPEFEQEAIVGGLLGVDTTVIVPQFLDEDAPFESVAVIETLYVPVAE